MTTRKPSSGQGRESCINKLIAVLTACTLPMQAQARPNPSLEMGIRNKQNKKQTLAVDLLAIVSCWKSKGGLSVRVYPLGS